MASHRKRSGKENMSPKQMPDKGAPQIRKRTSNASERTNGHFCSADMKLPSSYVGSRLNIDADLTSHAKVSHGDGAEIASGTHMTRTAVVDGGSRRVDK